jgi:hypothetical protein
MDLSRIKKADKYQLFYFLKFENSNELQVHEFFFGF